eukprot:NODE_3730_length_889_cov_5.258333_g3105_i0.p3 GENE.NODE_3730_length_889_cov_5.258333_g3105_i0~~NODE_3730_length_889_cov_5.258333_g3105_i0.p3  ORF type:complete len:54 (-),score=2.62 NODE_3730_length_889_cov_5.258333_g3105_i0:478-639(-)
MAPSLDPPPRQPSPTARLIPQVTCGMNFPASGRAGGLRSPCALRAQACFAGMT